MSSSEDDTPEFNEQDQEILVRNFEEEAKLIANNLLPKKSFSKYEVVYENFKKWQTDSKTKSFNEDVVLVYFDELSKKFKPSTIWARWSMLRTTLQLKHNVNIGDYQKLKSFLKNFSKGYKPKKANVLTWKEVETFLDQADDSVYLGMKVILIFGVSGALRCQEFVDINVNDVEDTGSQFIVQIRDSKTDYPRSFVIGKELYSKVKLYISLKPADTETKRFFLTYLKGKCVRQPVGKNKIAEVPKTVACYLNLDNSELYSGHSFRRTSATLLSNSGASLMEVKNLGGWKSDVVAQSYIDNSLAVKEKKFAGIVSARQVSSTDKSNVPKASSTVASSCNNLQLTESINALNEPLQEIKNSNNTKVSNKVKFQPQAVSIDSQFDNNDIPSRKKVCKESSTNTDTDQDSQLYTLRFYNCENITINYTVNNYSHNQNSNN